MESHHHHPSSSATPAPLPSLETLSLGSAASESAGESSVRETIEHDRSRQANILGEKGMASLDSEALTAVLIVGADFVGWEIGRNLCLSGARSVTVWDAEAARAEETAANLRALHTGSRIAVLECAPESLYATILASRFRTVVSTKASPFDGVFVGFARKFTDEPLADGVSRCVLSACVAGPQMTLVNFFSEGHEVSSDALDMAIKEEIAINIATTDEEARTAEVALIPPGGVIAAPALPGPEEDGEMAVDNGEFVEEVPLVGESWPPQLKDAPVKIIDPTGAILNTGIVTVRAHASGARVASLAFESPDDFDAVKLAAASDTKLFLEVTQVSEKISRIDGLDSIEREIKKAKVTTKGTAFVALLLSELMAAGAAFEEAAEVSCRVNGVNSVYFNDKNIAATRKAASRVLPGLCLVPMGAFIGGMAAMEILKVITGRFQPNTSFGFHEFSLGEEYSEPEELRTFLQDELPKKLNTVDVVVAGAGAVGCEVLRNIAAMGVAFGHIFDHDTVAFSNLHRQALYSTEDTNHNKALSAERKLNERYGTHFKGHAEPFTEDALSGLPKAPRCLLSCVDSHDVRWNIDAVAHAFDVPMIDGGTEGPLGHSVMVVPEKSQSHRGAYAAKEGERLETSCMPPNRITNSTHVIFLALALFEWLFNGMPSPKLVDDAKMVEEAEDAKARVIESGASDDKAVSALLALLFDKCLRTLVEEQPREYWKASVPQLIDFSEDSKMQVHLDRFGAALKSLVATREQTAEKRVPFDKDHEEAVDFVFTAAHIFAKILVIPAPSVLKTRRIAGKMQDAVLPITAMVSAMMSYNLYFLAHLDKDRLRACHGVNTQLNCPLNSYVFTAPPVNAAGAPAFAICGLASRATEGLWTALGDRPGYVTNFEGDCACMPPQSRGAWSLASVLPRLRPKRHHLLKVYPSLDDTADGKKAVAFVVRLDVEAVEEVDEAVA